MRRRPFFGKTIDWLEDELAKAQADYSAGTTSIGGAEGDVSFTEQAAMTPAERINAIFHELSCLDPVKYPPAIVVGSKTARGVFREEC